MTNPYVCYVLKTSNCDALGLRLFSRFDVVFHTVGDHYLRNRSERKTVRENVKVAKITYLEEVKQAQLLPSEELQHMYGFLKYFLYQFYNMN